MGGVVVSRIVIVGGGLLYPSYSSYKAVKNGDLRQLMRWIMYWIVFALFTALETFTDVFFFWLPFYYEIKVILVLWLSLPYTKGSRYLYKKFIHPSLSKNEQEIDYFLETAKDRSYKTLVRAGSKGINMAANAMVSVAIKGQTAVTNRLRSYSVIDLPSMRDDVGLLSQHGAKRNNSSPGILKDICLLKANHSQIQLYAGSECSNQYKSDSMINLTKPSVENSSNCEEFSTEPSLFTVDDMNISRKVNYAKEAVPQPDEYATRFYTMPRSRKCKNAHIPPLPSIHETFSSGSNDPHPVAYIHNSNQHESN